MPFLTTDVTDERDALATFVSQQLHQLATTLQGLSREQLAARPSASAFDLGTLARHCIRVAADYVLTIRSAPEYPEPSDSSGDAEQEQTGVVTDALRPQDDADGLIAELEQTAEQVAQVIREADLDVLVPVPEAPWFTGEEKWNVRWCALHLVEEFARHAGHADIIRESIDGKGAYELNARADGETWPPAGW